LIRALINENYNAAPAYVDLIRSTIEELEENKFDEALILSKRITKAAYELSKQQENLDIPHWFSSGHPGGNGIKALWYSKNTPRD